MGIMRAGGSHHGEEEHVALRSRCRSKQGPEISPGKAPSPERCRAMVWTVKRITKRGVFKRRPSFDNLLGDVVGDLACLFFEPSDSVVLPGAHESGWL